MYCRRCVRRTAVSGQPQVAIARGSYAAHIVDGERVVTFALENGEFNPVKANQSAFGRDPQITVIGDVHIPDRVGRQVTLRILCLSRQLRVETIQIN